MNLIDLLELFGLGLVLLIFTLTQRKWSLALLPGGLMLGCLGMAVLQFGPLNAPEPVQIPAYSRQVTDQTTTLSSGQQQLLTSQLQALQKATGAQLAVLIVPTTGALSIEQYSMQVVEKWKLGRKGVDDGVLLLVVKHDRSLRIEVGYGLEGKLTDALSSRIINDSMVPLLRQGDFAGAIQAGVGRISAAISGQPMASVEPVGDVPSVNSALPASTPQSSAKAHSPASAQPSASTSSSSGLSPQESNIGTAIIIALVVSYLCGPILGLLPIPLAGRALIACLIAAGSAGYILEDPRLALACGVGAAVLCAGRNGLGSARGSSSSSSSRSSSSGGGGRFGGGGSSGRW